MGFEALLLLLDYNEDSKIVKLNNKLNIDSYMCILAFMWAYFVIVINILHHDRYKLIFTTMRMKMASKDELSTNSVARFSEHIEVRASISLKPSTLEQFFYLICDLTTFIYKNSYILLNIIMMVSISILFH